MNREDRRKKDKSKKKKENKKVEAMRWINSLSKEKCELVKVYAKFIADRDNQNLTSALDRCMTAAITDKVDVTIEKIHEIMECFSDYLIDDGNKIGKNKEKFGGDLDMVAKKINALGPEVQEATREYIKQGMKQKELVETLATDYPLLSKAMITNAIKKVKTLIKEEEKELKKAEEKSKEATKKLLNILGNPDAETEELAEYILEEEPKEEPKEEKVEQKKVEEVEVKEEKIEEKKEGNTMKINNNLKIEAMILRGENGKYTVEDGKVTLERENNNVYFENIEQLEEWTSEIKQVFNIVKGA